MKLLILRNNLVDEMGVDEMGADEMGIGELGVDDMGSRRSRMTPIFEIIY